MLPTTDVAQRRLLRYIPVAVLVVGMTTAAWGFARVQAFDAAQMRLDLERRAHSTIRAVEKELAEYARLLDTMAAFVQLGAVGREPPAPPSDTAYWIRQVEPYRANTRSFRLWVDAVIDQYPGAYALGWLQEVDHPWRPGHEAFARATVDPNYRIRERDPSGRAIPARTRPTYFPVFSIEPQSAREAAIGLDVGVEDAVAEAIRQACATGETTATLTATLFPGETGRTQLTVRPIRGLDSAGIATATCNETTLAFGAFRVADIISAALAGLPDQDIELQVTNGDAAHASAVALYTSAGYDSSRQPTAAALEVLTEAVLGYPLFFEVRPTARLLRQHHTGQPWIVFLMGTLLTGVAVTLAVQTERRHAHIARTVAKRTRELETANQLLETETRRKAALEVRLRESLKMEAVGTLAAGIAHDFNNLLTPIIGSCEFLKMEAASGDRIHEYADQIQASAERAAQLTQQLLGFARKGKLQHVAVPIDDLVRRVVEFLHRTMAKTIVIQKALDAGDAAVLGDPDQLHQVLVNLAGNATDAMLDGGTLTFTTQVTNVSEDTARPMVDARPGPHVCLAVTDTGIGIPPSIRDRVFEPYFTTKGVGKGSGMGLAMVYGIIRNHGGFVQVVPGATGGTTLLIHLPIATQDAVVRALPGPH